MNNNVNKYENIPNNLLSVNVSNIGTENEENNAYIDKIIPENGQINVDSSSEVTIGNITHFNGPVTIYQTTRNAENNFIDRNEDLTKFQQPLQSPEKPQPSDNCSKSFIFGLIIISAIIIIISVTLATYLRTNHEEDKPPGTPKTYTDQHQLIPRSQWGGRPPSYERPLHHPTLYVIISHTASQKCDSTSECSRLVAQFQSQHISEFNSPDVGYNFLIGGDANIYIGRGWDAENFHMADSIGISFIGNFVYDRLKPGMIEAAHILLKDGLDKGKLDKNYKLISHNQTGTTLSPGQNVYDSIRFWPHFTPELVPIIP